MRSARRSPRLDNMHGGAFGELRLNIPADAVTLCEPVLEFSEALARYLGLRSSSKIARSTWWPKSMPGYDTGTRFLRT